MEREKEKEKEKEKERKSEDYLPESDSIAAIAA